MAITDGMSWAPHATSNTTENMRFRVNWPKTILQAP